MFSLLSNTVSDMRYSIKIENVFSLPSLSMADMTPNYKSMVVIGKLCRGIFLDGRFRWNNLEVLCNAHRSS